MRVAALTAAVALTATGFTGCDDDSTIGSSLTQDELSVVVNDTSFSLTGHSVDADTVLSRTITQLLGSIDAPGYGTLSSDFVTQFMPALSLDTAGVTAGDIDSLKLVMMMDLTAYTGDSLAPMGLQVFRLTEPLKTPIYSTFRPTGMYNPDEVIGSTMYNASLAGVPDSLRPTSGYQTFFVDLPRSLGRELFSAYKANPANFSTPTLFAQNVFKGLYIKNSYGSGRIIRIAQTTMRMYYHTTVKTSDGRDSVVNKTGSYFAVTPEIISNNNIHMSLAQNLRDSVAAGAALLVAPCGLDVVMTLPVPQILQSYRSSITSLGVINSLGITIPAHAVANKYNIGTPPNVLMVLSKDKEQFFAKNRVPDNKTSFLATYDSQTGTYTFGALREYIVDMLAKETVTPDDYTFTLVPVTVSTETSQSSYYYQGTSTVTAVTPYVSNPVMTSLDLKGAKISFVYTKQSLL